MTIREKEYIKDQIINNAYWYNYFQKMGKTAEASDYYILLREYRNFYEIFCSEIDVEWGGDKLITFIGFDKFTNEFGRIDYRYSYDTGEKHI